MMTPARSIHSPTGSRSRSSLARRARCTAKVTMRTTRPMPYAFGLHPGFRWPGDASAQVTFDAEEEASVPVITSDGLFAQGSPSCRARGPPTRGHARRDGAGGTVLSRTCVRRRSHTRRRGFGRLRIEHDDFPHVALWSRPPAPFLCIESWTGHGDPRALTANCAKSRRCACCRRAARRSTPRLIRSRRRPDGLHSAVRL